MLHRAERSRLLGPACQSKMRVGCGKELLGMLKESLAHQRERWVLLCCAIATSLQLEERSLFGHGSLSSGKSSPSKAFPTSSRSGVATHWNDPENLSPDADWMNRRGTEAWHSPRAVPCESRSTTRLVHRFRPLVEIDLPVGWYGISLSLSLSR